MKEDNNKVESLLLWKKTKLRYHLLNLMISHLANVITNQSKAIIGINKTYIPPSNPKTQNKHVKPKKDRKNTIVYQVGIKKLIVCFKLIIRLYQKIFYLYNSRLMGYCVNMVNGVNYHTKHLRRCLRSNISFCKLKKFEHLLPFKFIASNLFYLPFLC